MIVLRRWNAALAGTPPLVTGKGLTTVFSAVGMLLLWSSGDQLAALGAFVLFGVGAMGTVGVALIGGSAARNHRAAGIDPPPPTSPHPPFKGANTRVETARARSPQPPSSAPSMQAGGAVVVPFRSPCRPPR